jgi:hypothetical protein
MPTLDASNIFYLGYFAAYRHLEKLAGQYRLPPPKSEPKMPRTICRPTEELALRITLFAAAVRRPSRRPLPKRTSVKTLVPAPAPPSFAAAPRAPGAFAAAACTARAASFS